MILKDVKVCVLSLTIYALIFGFFYQYKRGFPSSYQQYYDKHCGFECITKILNETEPFQYLIHTPTCVIPNIPDDHPSIAKYKVKEPQKVMCSTKDALTQEEGLTLKFYPERICQYGLPNRRSSINCSYQGITRIQQDPNKYNKRCDGKGKLNETRIPITEEVMPIDEDAILVTCFNATDQKQKPIYQNVHYFLQPRRAQEKRKKQEAEGVRRTARPKQLNVILLGTDAVSRSNLLRNMPKTYNYLTEHLEAIDLRGYNKIGDNTYPNIVALLLGLTEKQLKRTCLPTPGHKLDDCPFVWQNGSQKGYVTCYAEDLPSGGIFQYGLTGFVKQPTDYYNIAYFYISDDYIGHDGGTPSLNRKMCQGGKQSMSVIHDYSLTLAESFKDVPTFGMYWSTSLTHDSVMRASVADQLCLEYLQKLHDGGNLEDTIMFFMSDHGMRYGDIRATYAGMLEERLPYMMVVLPVWFKDEYPEAVNNLHINTRRLTSPFDIHATLHDILNEAYADLSQSYRKERLHGQSLFVEVPLNRTCKDAGVIPHYCTCQKTVEADTNDHHLWESAKYTVKTLNQALCQFNVCVELNLDKIVSGRVRLPSDGTKPTQKDSAANNYIVSFVTKPGGAKIESSVHYSGGKYELMAGVSRINAYGNESHCIQDVTYKKYCYCKDLLQ